MSLFDAGNICTFSQVNAKITFNGKPATGALVTRIAKLKETKKEETTTNSNGEFSFPAIFEKSLKKLLPVEIVISQQMLVEYQGETYEIWANGKMNPAENSELDGQLLNLNCELTDELRTHRTSSSLIMTNCVWEEQ